MSTVVKVEEDNFDSTVLKSGKAVLVDFWADWCAPCKALLPILDEAAKELDENQAIIAKVDVMKNPTLAQRYNISSIPALLFFKNGELKKKLFGRQPKNEIVNGLKELG